MRNVIIELQMDDQNFLASFLRIRDHETRLVRHIYEWEMRRSEVNYEKALKSAFNVVYTTGRYTVNPKEG